jgi:hypothetical protein
MLAKYGETPIGAVNEVAPRALARPRVALVGPTIPVYVLYTGNRTVRYMAKK